VVVKADTATSAEDGPKLNLRTHTETWEQWNSASATITITEPKADLSVTADNVSGKVGATGLSLTLNISNAGPDTAKGAYLTILTPKFANLELSELVSDDFSCIEIPGGSNSSDYRIYFCSAATLAPGDYSLQLPVSANYEGSRTFSTSIQSSITDPDGDNNSVDISYDITAPQANLSVTSSSTSGYNNQINYLTINYKNAGPDVANNVTISAELPLAATYVGANAPGFSCTSADGYVTCTAASLATSQALQSFQIYFNTTTVQTNTQLNLSISSDTSDPDTTNNEATLNLTIAAPPSADMLIYDLQQPFLGLSQPTEITVANSGPNTATNVKVTFDFLFNSYMAAIQPLQMIPGWTCIPFDMGRDSATPYQRVRAECNPIPSSLSNLQSATLEIIPVFNIKPVYVLVTSSVTDPNSSNNVWGTPFN
jgi:Domain of unknown function DUF11